jgi:hypothetical protein
MNDDLNGLDVAPESALQKQQAMLSQDEVNKLVGAAKAQAAAQERSRAEAEFQKKLADLQQQKAFAESRGEDTKDINVEAIYQQVQERMQSEFKKKQLEEHFQSKSTAYLNKMESGKKDFEDFDTVMGGFDPREFPQLVYLVADMDNAAAVMRELMNDPKELAAIDYLAQRSPRKAQDALKAISQSIISNQNVMSMERNAQAKEPLSRLNASATTTGNGKMTISDLRAQPWMR